MAAGLSLPNGQHADGLRGGELAIHGPDPQIIRALDLIYDPRVSNANRREASQYLEHLSSQDEAPYNGFMFASDKSNQATVRHFGLSLLDNAIRLRWMSLSNQQQVAIRDWILRLAQEIDKGDPLYIRNKIAQLWVEIAKRSWALDWMDMDERLVRLWSASTVQKILVLEVLETLSENSFGKEDAITALRGSDLNRACVEIFTPQVVSTKHLPEGDAAAAMAYGSEGWLLRISDLLDRCLQQDPRCDEAQMCATRSLAVLRSAAAWVLPLTLGETHCVQRACQLMMRGTPATQLAAVEMLSALYARHSFQEPDMRALIGPLFQDATVDGLRRLYEWTIVDPEEIDDQKYLLSKKLSEMLHNVGRYLKDYPPDLFGASDISEFLQLLVQILRNDSLHVSIPALHLWVQFLASPLSSASWDHIVPFVGPLLETCSQRLIRYELLPPESTVPTITFLNEDIDTTPEKHAFLGNYARFCRDVVDAIVEKQPFGALSHILGQTDSSVCEILHSHQLDVRNFSKTSLPALKMDSQCAVVEAGLHGYYRWRNAQKMKNGAHVESSGQHASMTSNIETWCNQLMELQYDDPSICQRILTLIMEFAVNPLRRNAPFVKRFFEYLLDTKARLLTISIPPEAHLYSEAVKELQRYCGLQLQRLAKRCSDILLQAFDDIEGAIGRYCDVAHVDDEDKERCVSVLLMIVQRASDLNQDTRMKRLDSYVQPTISKWVDADLTQPLRSFDGFCRLLGVTGCSQYFLKRNALQISDWAESRLDEEGMAMKSRIEAAQQALPLRATKTFFSATIDKADDAHTNAIPTELWTKHMPIMLPSLLQMISLDHMYSDPSTWCEASKDGQMIIRRILKDRWWQVGISSGSRDEFYSKVEQSKSSLEGLASAIRGALRFVRETSYKLLSSMAYLGTSLFEVAELPEALSKAIFGHSGALSTHQSAVIIEMMRSLIERCPPASRGYFLTPMLVAMFTSLDGKIRAEWNMIDRQNQGDDGAVNGTLVDEMKNESVLRQLTYNSVTIVISILDPHESRCPFPRVPDVIVAK